MMWGSFTGGQVIDDAIENCGETITLIALRAGGALLLGTNDDDDDVDGVTMVVAAVTIITAAAMLATDNA